MFDVSDELFDPSDSDFIADPYPVYRELRDLAPVYYYEASDVWLLTRFADVERATSDYETFSSCKGNVIVDSPVRVGKTLGSLDPPRHDELRRIIQRTLSPARVKALLPELRRATHGLLDEVRNRDEIDFVAEFSRPLLFTAIGLLLGLDAGASARSAQLMGGLFRGDDGPLGPVLPAGRFEAIAAFLREELEGREVTLGDDLFSVLLKARDDGAPLNDAEIVANLSTVLLAGNASIGHFFPNIFHTLWLHPDARREVLADPSIIPAAIEETVRWDTSTQCFARQVTRDVELHGTTLCAGSRVAAFYGSANRDERVIEAAEVFDIGRRRVPHFGFGMGPHHCAGAHVARSILRSIMEDALPIFGEFELDISRASRARHVMVRGFTALPMAMKAKGVVT